jgi:hypothetical protein
MSISEEDVIELVRDLSRLDGDVTERCAFDRAGKQVSKSVLADSKILGDLLAKGKTPEECLIPGKSDQRRSLHEFLDKALYQAISRATDAGENGAGAIYLYNSQHAELVMAASQGFPFCNTHTWLQQYKTVLGNVPGRNDERNSASAELERNISRLHHVQSNIKPMLCPTVIARDDWVRKELKAVYDSPKASDTTTLDCNKALIGVAYYKLGSSGITVQLFDPKTGPTLERPFDDKFPGAYDAKTDLAFPALVGPDARLCEFAKKELLRKRTIVYKSRDQMGAGRQVRAGVYEGVQFPHRRFIGPFLGTVLRFNGEHLGILKVEKHQFNQKEQRDKHGLSKFFTKALPFRASKTLDFLLFAYALSGILYLRKYYSGKDLSEGWTSSENT